MTPCLYQPTHSFHCRTALLSLSLRQLFSPPATLSKSLSFPTSLIPNAFSTTFLSELPMRLHDLLNLNWFHQKKFLHLKTLALPLNAYMLHNLAHVELNAIDLAWDTVVRFSPFSEFLGESFFVDFAHVADDESRHFLWCSQRLAELGFKYGDMPAHNLLWRECKKSSGNVAARLAAIPLVQEARGLDAGPRLVQKLIGFGDSRTSNIVAKIADDSNLTEVYERLAYVISMEKDNLSASVINPFG